MYAHPEDDPEFIDQRFAASDILMSEGITRRFIDPSQAEVLKAVSGLLVAREFIYITDFADARNVRPGNAQKQLHNLEHKYKLLYSFAEPGQNSPHAQARRLYGATILGHRVFGLFQPEQIKD